MMENKVSRKQMKWTAEQEEFLKNNFASIISLDILAKNLGRSRGAVNAKAREMGLTRPNFRRGNPNFGKKRTGPNGNSEPFEFIFEGKKVVGQLVNKLDHAVIVNYSGEKYVVHNIRKRKNFLHAVIPTKETIWEKW